MGQETWSNKKWLDEQLALGKELPEVGYKVYKALLTQTGTASPVAIVLQNTLGGDVVWSYNDVGTYIATLNDVFLDGKTFIYPIKNTLNTSTNALSMEIFGIGRNNNDSIYLTTGYITFTAADDVTKDNYDEILYNTEILIEVHP